MQPNFIQLAQQQKRHIVLPESTAKRVLQAAVIADQQGIANITLAGEANAIHAQLDALGLSIGGIQIKDPSVADAQSQAYAQLLFEKRQHKGLTLAQATELCQKPLFYADLMVHAGDADGCVAGAINSTGDVISAALQTIGTATPKTRLSSFFIMLLDKPAFPSTVLYADCAINIQPNASQLADIAQQSAKNAQRLLGLDPKVALLSFSTNGSAQHAEVDKVREATALIKEQAPDLNVIGEVQFDAAIAPDILERKWPNADFDAPANVYIFPSLEAGNLAYKITQRLGDAEAIGPILQGLAKPVNDLSRGASVEDIVKTIAVTSLQVVD